jgi:aminoglycoside phosphotransferase (APT) family kinase protein
MGIDRQQAFSGTTGSDLPLAPLEAWLAANISGFAGPLAARRFKGGQSNPTYLLETPGKRYVLRRKPSGKLLPSAHAIEREFRVTGALASAGFPVATPYALCADDTVIGVPFFVMAHVEGRIFWQPYAPGPSGQDRAALFDSMNATIAHLHGFDIAALGLADFGRPKGYVTRQVQRWTKQYRASETDAIPEMDDLIAWLPTALPPQTANAIVHGDFRLDNCIVHSTEPKVIAVLDWELSALGDPLADFTYHLMQWFMPASESGAGVGTLAGHEHEAGIPAINDYIRAYANRTGRQGLDNLDVYLAYNFFRLAAILQGILGRVRDGTAANAEAALMAENVRPLARTAWAFARKAGA